MTPPKPSLHEPLGLFLVALVIRSLLLFATDNNCTDGLARYEIAADWIRDPLKLPSQIWLPLHFWLIGILQWPWPGELSARVTSLLFGAATVFPFFGIARLAFDRGVALYSTLTYSLLGLHLAYSVCSSSEAPTLFFLMGGVYCWARYRIEPAWRWLLGGGAMLSAACLCRFEPWLLVAAASALLLVPDESTGAPVWPSRDRWLRAIGFGLAASAGAIGWMIFSIVEWGDPFAAPQRTFVQNATDVLKMEHSLLYRIAVVPGALVVSLSPFVALCAVPGAVRALQRPRSLAAALVTLAAVAGGAHLYSSITRDVTQARYTMMYSWLLVPLAYEGLRALRWSALGRRPQRRYAWLLVGFLVWQGGIVLGAHKGPPRLADRLSVVSPTMPLAVELRSLTAWLREHVQPGDAVILDDFNYDHVWIVRDSLARENVLIVPRLDRGAVEAQIARFVEERKPEFLVYSERGQLGRLWELPDDRRVTVSGPPLTLHEAWRGASYRVFRIEPERELPPGPAKGS